MLKIVAIGFTSLSRAPVRMHLRVIAGSPAIRDA